MPPPPGFPRPRLSSGRCCTFRGTGEHRPRPQAHRRRPRRRRAGADATDHRVRSGGMIFVDVLAVLFGLAFVGAVLISALETVILPRNGFTRMTRSVFAVTDRILIHRWHNQEREANLRALYGPVALISLPL